MEIFICITRIILKNVDEMIPLIDLIRKVRTVNYIPKFFREKIKGD